MGPGNGSGTPAARTVLPFLYAETGVPGDPSAVGPPAVRHGLVVSRLCRGERGSPGRKSCGVRKGTVATRPEDDTLTGVKEHNYHIHPGAIIFHCKLVNWQPGS